MQFSELNLIPEIVRATEEIGYQEATDIQVGAIPVLLEGKDLIGRSSTGTGKTAAFGLPIVQMVNQNGQARGQVLILSPTRELAIQTSEEVRKFSKYLQNIKIAVVCGGQSMPMQIRQLRTAQMIIGTPGRIMDHMRRQTLSLENLKTVILDEADEMLNMGFLEDIQTILKQAPETRQTVLFSATMPPAIMKITKEFQTNPKIIAVDQGRKTVDNISQFYYHIHQADKINALKLLLEYHHPKRAVIFCNTKKMVNELCEELNDSGFQTAGIHGDLKQNQRNQVMSDFKTGRNSILVATDVAARGIDVEDVDAVFNYDIPDEDEYYIHRIGRTGRAGKTGASYTLATSRSQLQRLYSLEKFMNLKIQEAPIPDLAEIQERRLKKFREKIKQLVAENNGSQWLTFVEALEQDGYEAKNIAAALCEEMSGKGRKLSALKNVRKMQPDSAKSAVMEPGKAKLSLNIGTNSKIKPDFLLGTIVEATGLPIGAVGKIEMHSEHTTIEMAPADAAFAVQKMNGYRIKQRTVHATLSGNKKDGRNPGSKNGMSQSKNRRSGGKPRAPFYSGHLHSAGRNKRKAK